MKTIADLLKSINMVHQIPEDSPLLAVPLSLFNEQEYHEIVALLWLYNAGWLIPLDDKIMKLNLADLSKSEVTIFHETILNHAKKACDVLKKQSTANEPIAPWNLKLVPSHKWVNASQVTLYLQGSFVYQTLFNPKKPASRKTVSLNPAFDKEINQHDLTQKYSTLGEFFKKIPIVLHGTLPSAMQLIMALKIEEIKGITEEELLKLTCYLTLFISRRASITPLISCYSYANQQIKDIVQQVIEEQTKVMPQFFKGGKVKSLPVDTILMNQLMQKGMGLDPELLGLICFESYPILKQLYERVWIKSGIDITQIPYHSISLSPAPNPFLYGWVIYSSITKQAVQTSNHDQDIIIKLLQLNNPPQTTVGSFFIPPIFPSKEEQFENLRIQIKDYQLRISITPQEIKNYFTVPFSNLNAITSFLLRFGPTSSNTIPPSNIQLKLFLNALPINQVTIDFLVLSQKFINLNQSDLPQQKEKVETTRIRLEKEIQEIKLSKVTESVQLQINWLELQHAIWAEFNKILTARLEETETEELVPSIFTLK